MRPDTYGTILRLHLLRFEQHLSRQPMSLLTVVTSAQGSFFGRVDFLTGFFPVLAALLPGALPEPEAFPEPLPLFPDAALVSFRTPTILQTVSDPFSNTLRSPAFSASETRRLSERSTSL